MQKIVFDSAVLSGQHEIMRQVELGLNQAAQDLNDINRSLSWKITAGTKIKQSITGYNSNLQQLSQTSGTLGNVLTEVSSRYEETERRLAGTGVAVAKGKSAQSNQGVQNSAETQQDTRNWWEKLKDKVKSGQEKIKTGVAKVVESAKKVTSAIVDDYKNKGTTWKLIKTGCAVVSSIAAVTAAAAAWGLTAGSAGVGAPLASLVTLHSANTLASNFADIYNCWAGDKNQVGEVNALKSIDEKIFGKTVGDVVYNVASVTSAIASVTAISGQLKQAPDMAKAIKGSGKELSKGISGVKDIAKDVLTGKSTLSRARFDYVMLKKDLTNVADLDKCVSIIYKAGETTKKIADAVAAPIYERIHPEGKYSSSLVDVLYGTDNAYSKVKKVYDDIKSAASIGSKSTYKDLYGAYQADKITQR